MKLSEQINEAERIQKEAMVFMYIVLSTLLWKLSLIKEQFSQDSVQETEMWLTYRA
jgi:hypothetical protein